MTITKADLTGIVCAAVTPLRNGKPDLDAMQQHVKTLAAEGCDGLLLGGTTGEGPSLGMGEREAIIEAVMDVAGDLIVMAGTASASLPDTIDATRRAFELGAHAAVLVPPYYFKNVSDDGVFEWYKRVFDEAVPDDRLLIVYHIPKVTAVPLSFELLARLVDYAGDRMAGIKDTSLDLQHGIDLCRELPDLQVFVGHCKLLLDGVKAGGAGCITAGANVLAPLAVDTYRAYQAGEGAEAKQELLTKARTAIDQFPPGGPTLKSLLELRYHPSSWEVRPPLMRISTAERDMVLQNLRGLNLPRQLDWLTAAITG